MAPLFDVDPDQHLEIRVLCPSGDKVIVVRHMSDDQFLRRTRSCKILRRDLGRKVSEDTIVRSPSADLELAKEVVISGPPLDAQEAGHVLDKLSEPSGLAAIEGTAIRITLRALGVFDLQHLIRIPSTEELTAHRSSAIRILEYPRNPRELRIDYVLRGAFFDSLALDRVGYAEHSATPLSHKSAAITAALDHLRY